MRATEFASGQSRDTGPSRREATATGPSGKHGVIDMSQLPITDEELTYLIRMSAMGVKGNRHGGQLVAAMVLQQRDEIAELRLGIAQLIEDREGTL